MSSPTVNPEDLEKFGPLLIKYGYDSINTDELQIAEPELSGKEFINKALICEIWMEQHDKKVRKQHDQLLDSGQTEYEILKTYFDELETFMVESNYRGCPFVQTARNIKGQEEVGIKHRIQQHKLEVRRFFQKLCERITFNSESIAEAIFLIYMGAMSESNDMMTLEPIESGREAALTLFKKFLPA